MNHLPRIDRRTAIKWMLAASATMAIDPRFARAESAAAPSGKGYGTDPDLMRHYKPGELWPLSLTEAQRRTTDLSGGEQQRVAIARALANDPDVLLADEPTGNLDKHNAENIAGIFEEIAGLGNRTILMVTHDPHMAERAQRIVTLDDGHIVDDVRRTTNRDA